MYEKHILRILWDVGVRGISTKKLAKHVYNLSCTLFSQPDFDEVYKFTSRYVRRQSQSKQGLVEHAQKWGHYRLNMKNASDYCQFMQKLDEENESETVGDGRNLPIDLSLDLFD